MSQLAYHASVNDSCSNVFRYILSARFIRRELNIIIARARGEWRVTSQFALYWRVTFHAESMTKGPFGRRGVVLAASNTTYKIGDLRANFVGKVAYRSPPQYA